MQALLDATRARLEDHTRLFARLVPYDVLKRQWNDRRIRAIEEQIDPAFPSGFIEADPHSVDDGSEYGDPMVDPRPAWLRAIDMFDR